MLGWGILDPLHDFRVAGPLLLFFLRSPIDFWVNVEPTQDGRLLTKSLAALPISIF